jgi:N-acetylglucosamine-6-phosphate deacetylase
MSEAALHAWHYRTRQPVEIRWRDGVITSVRAAEPDRASRVWIAPGLVDLQINGFGGIDFQQDNLTREQLLSAVRQLRASGCPRFLLTLITDEWSRLTNRLRHLREVREQSEELRAAITGWHIEGPFLSSQPGYCGAHNPSAMRDPTAERIRELRALTGTDATLLTLAPERAGALEAIALAVSSGMRVSLGHTNASAQVLRDARQAGATGFTHLGNACPRELDRHDNILWRVFEAKGLFASLIPDRIHVSPSLFRLAHRLLDESSIYYTTDAMAAAGAPPGRYRLGRAEFDVGEDQIVRQPGQSNFAGSALKPIDGVFRAAEMLGQTWNDVWDRFSLRPAQWMGLNCDLSPGNEASFCVLHLDGAANQLVNLQVFFRGKD